MIDFISVYFNKSTVIKLTPQQTRKRLVALGLLFLVNIFFWMAFHQNGFTLTIFGTDYDTSDGTCIRDYIHVEDLAEAHVLALEKLFSENKSGIYNLGNGKGFSVKEVIDSVERVSGKKAKVKEGERREGDPAFLVASSELAQKELNWKIKFEDLDSIVKSAWQWESSGKREK